MKEPEKHPQWFIDLCAFQPRFPGDGFCHTFRTNRIKQRFTCPCGETMVFFIKEVQPYGSTVATCPTCRSWHSVLWTHEKRKPVVIKIKQNG